MPSIPGEYLHERELDTVLQQDLENFLVNEEIGKAIKIPDNIISILLKFSSTVGTFYSKLKIFNYKTKLIALDLGKN